MSDEDIGRTWPDLIVEYGEEIFWAIIIIILVFSCAVPKGCSISINSQPNNQVSEKSAENK